MGLGVRQSRVYREERASSLHSGNPFCEVLLGIVVRFWGERKAVVMVVW
jgi:hypothetical protein